MVCTPTVVCTIIGNTDEMKIRKIGDTSPTPNHRIAIGIQAIGEIGRSIWNSGLSVSNAPVDPTHPQAERNRDQERQAEPDRRRASATRRICSHKRAVLGQFAALRSRPAAGSERSRCRFLTTTSHQTRDQEHDHEHRRHDLDQAVVDLPHPIPRQIRRWSRITPRSSGCANASAAVPSPAEGSARRSR